MDSSGEADWELVSSSSNGGEGSREVQEEAAALARSFQLAEPGPEMGSSPASSHGDTTLLPHFAAGGSYPARGETTEPAPGSPQRLQHLQLLAAPLPPAPNAAAASARPPLGAATLAPHGSPAVLAGAAASCTASTGEKTEAEGSPAGAVAASGGGAGSSEDLRLRVVRADELEALERAMTALGKSSGASAAAPPVPPPRCRAARREEDLTLARLRMSGAQAELASDSREACKLRRIAVLACSVCAFLGLKALLAEAPSKGGCSTGASCGAASSAAGQLATPMAGLSSPLLSEAELERLVAVKVEPLPLPSGSAR